MLFLYLVMVSTVVGAIAATRLGGHSVIMIAVGIIGAVGGALLTFGDAPWLMRHPLVNPFTMSVVGAGLLILLARGLAAAMSRLR